VEQNTKESNRLEDNQHFQEPIEQSLEKSGYKIFTRYQDDITFFKTYFVVKVKFDIGT
jgi:hypothetical protein